MDIYDTMMLYLWKQLLPFLIHTLFKLYGLYIVDRWTAAII